MISLFSEASQSDPPRFLREDIVILQMIGGMGWGVGEVAVVRNLPNPISGKSTVLLPDRSAAPILASSNGSLLACDVNEVYETRSGERLTLPHGRRFHPELSQFSEDGKYTVFPGSFVVDLLVEKKIGGNPDRRLLTKQNAAIDADLLQQWCQLITRGRLDEAGRFSKIDEAEWEKLRQGLAHELDKTANAQVLRTAVNDRLYWLRQELVGASAPLKLPLLDRLVAAEPTWTNYDQRAQVHFGRGQWYEAIRDELEAARLLGDRYRRNRDNTPTARMLFDGLALAPGRPREQYELALRWVEANKVVGQLISAQNRMALPFVSTSSRTVYEI